MAEWYLEEVGDGDSVRLEVDFLGEFVLKGKGRKRSLSDSWQKGQT